jgi:hypothetical protein
MRQKVAAAAPSNADWQHPLSASYGKMGDTLAAQGLPGDALGSYQACLAIIQKLIAADPANTRWQIDLVSISWKLSALDAPGNSAAERRWVLASALEVAEELERAGRLTAQQQSWPEQLRKALQELDRNP